MALKMNKVENFPEITRAGRQSEDLQAIIEALHESVKTGQKFSLTVEPGNPYNSMQQRIRAQAKKLNFKVVIRFDANEKKLYFKATSENANTQTTAKTEVKTSDIKAIKTQTSKSVTK